MPQVPAVPQWQAPSEEHVSALRESQATQGAPAVPQVANDRIRQAVPEQQPEGHEVASQTHAPSMQCWPGPQTTSLPH